MMDFYKRALELKDETVADRRYIHENAEAGLELPKTKAYVMDKLKEYGLDPVECGEGVTAMLGNGGKVLLLRADMDGLPMPEYWKRNPITYRLSTGGRFFAV